MKLFSGLFSLFFLFVCTQSLIHDLSIKSDGRDVFEIEKFGFSDGGKYIITIDHIILNGEPFADVKNADKSKFGFLIKTSPTSSTSFFDENAGVSCLLTADRIDPEKGDFLVFLDKDNDITTMEYTIKEGLGAYYHTFFVSCLFGAEFSLDIRLEQYNINPANKAHNYLPVGQSSLPTLYLFFALFYSVVIFAWMHMIRRLKRIDGPASNVNRVHYLMSVLLILKMLSIFFKSLMYFYMKHHGSHGGWSIPYFIFAFMKGTFLFVLIALIGTGWSFVKPFLSEKDKRIFLVVIPLQIIDNIALIIIEEAAPGSRGWMNWQDVFHLVDIICCGAVIIPILWSIKHLKEASKVDGKAAVNLQKLRLFREFYLLVVSYIYITRIVIFLLTVTLSYQAEWVSVFFGEFTTIIFFCVVGFKFRPSKENPYFSQLPSIEEDRFAILTNNIDSENPSSPNSIELEKFDNDTK